MVLGKFFRKKNTTEKTSKASAGAGRAAPQGSGLDHWVDQASSADARHRKEAMVELARALDDGRLTAGHLQELPPAEQLALDLHKQKDVADDIDEALWFEVASHGFSSRIRVEAAGRIEDSANLDSLLRNAKGRDKSVYRLVKTRLDESRRASDQVRLKKDRSKRLVEQLERHANAPVDPLFSGKLRALLEQWAGSQDYADDALVARWQAAAKRAQDRLPAEPPAKHSGDGLSTDVPVEEQAGTDEPEPVGMQRTVASDPVRDELIRQVWHDLKDRIDQPGLDHERLQDARAYLSGQRHQWRESEQRQPANSHEEQAFQQLCSVYEASLESLAQITGRFGPLDALFASVEADPASQDAAAQALDEWLQRLHWSADEPEPELKSQVEKAVQQHHDRLAEHRKQAVNASRQARALIRRCQSAVAEGHLKLASGLLQGITDALAGLRPDEHQGLFRQFHETEQAVEKLRDWQSFAVLPKKEALVQRMRQLNSVSLVPEDRARQIREMQNEWRMLSRGLQGQHQELWETFHELAQKAYEPCKEFFDEQGKLRALNLQQRQALVDHLKQYEQLIDGKSHDLKELDRVLGLARNDWRRFSPVDRAANKAVQTDFDLIFGRLHALLQNEQQVFRDIKLALIERARALLDEPDSRQATDAAKQLQMEWKQTGHLTRRDEQALWKTFRAICDQLFARREADAAAFKADLNAHREQAGEILAGMKAIVKEPDPQEATQHFDTLKQRFKELGTLPKTDYKKLHDRFERLNQEFEAKCQRAKQHQRGQHWQALFIWSRKARFELSGQEAAESEWDALANVPAAAANLRTSIPDWQKESDDGDALRRRTVELEILTGAETPEVDKGLRMELQVQRLTDGFGQQVDQNDVDQAVVSWLETPARDEAQFDTLMERVKHAWLFWLERSGNRKTEKNHKVS